MIRRLMYLAFEYNYSLHARHTPAPCPGVNIHVGDVDILNLTTMPLESGFLQGLIGDKCVLILSYNGERESSF